VATCRMRDTWRGAARWTPWCGAAVAALRAGISGAGGSARGTPPGQPRTGSGPASARLEAKESLVYW
jgi:hypothetical protein